ncbi:MAG: hypothetical protein WCE21_05200, partial [Candidatus Babeliales bacterium]
MSPRSNKAFDDINRAIYQENARRKKEEKDGIRVKEERERREKAVDEKWLRKKARGCHADDIVQAGKWVTEFNHGVVQTTDGFIRRKDTYTPHNVDLNSNDKATMIVVHGTWGAPTKSFYKDTSSKYQNYRHMKRFAAWYASKYQKELSLESYQWSGELDEVRRSNAACKLKNYINENHAHDQLVLMSHSHGGNLISTATHSLNTPADLLVYFACPIRKDYLANHPDKFKRLVYFHSDTDLTSKGGRIPEQELMQNGLGSVILANRIVNYSLHGRPISALLSLWGLSKTITPLAETFFESDNIFPLYPNKNMIGIHSI